MRKTSVLSTILFFANTALITLIVGTFIIGQGAFAHAKEGGGVAGLTWQWQYDQKGRVSDIKLQGEVTARVTYEEQDAKANKGETRTVQFSDEKRTFIWDPKGRLISAEGIDGKIAFNRNKAGLPTEVRSIGTPTIRYRYDVHDRLTETNIGDVAAIQYRYDYLGRLAAIVTPSGEIKYSYHRASNKVIRRLPNGVQTFREYDDEGKLIKITHVDPKNFIIAEYTYSYRPDRLIEGIIETTQRRGEQVCQYQYSLMQRLTGVACGEKGRSYHYGYDSLGNLAESQTVGGQLLHFTSTPAGALATDSRGVTHTDERGHIRQLPDTPSPITYKFNGAGELSVAATNGKKIGYAYNALGLLTARTIDGHETRYLPDPFADAWHPLWQRNADGAETITVWDGAIPLVLLQGKEVHFLLEDYLGSVRMAVDNRGRVVAWHDYTPYGVQEETNTDSDLRPGFAGLFWDPTAKIYHAMARAYDPMTARFLQPDPQLRLPGASKHSHSLYAYTGGDPVNFVDRNGAWPSPSNDEHLNRNRLNRFPDGELRLKSNPNNERPSFQYNDPKGREYLDESGRIWTLEPDSKNAFHQTTPQLGSLMRWLYDAPMDPYTKTYKFTSPAPNGGSYEAIFVPGGGLGRRKVTSFVILLCPGIWYPSLRAVFV